jgi:hypothetical protein
MIIVDTTLRYSIGIWLGVILGACTWASSNKTETKPSALVEMANGGLLVSSSGSAELGLVLINKSARTLWVSTHFVTPDGQSDCILVKELEPQAKRLYTCPQAEIHAEADYPVHIAIFADLKQSHILGSLETSFRFDQSDVQVIEQSGGS